MNAKEWFDNLSRSEKFELGDAFVLGYYNWQDWFIDPPSKQFTKELTKVWRDWEINGE